VKYLLILLLSVVAIAINSCAHSRQVQQIQQEAFERTRIEAFRDYLRPDGTIEADVGRGKAVYQMNCVPCHGEQGDKLNSGTQDNPRYLQHKAISDPEGFFRLTNFGDKERNMLAYHDEIELTDLVAVTAYVQTLINQ
jgi:mono/diheme cytochrome c family protein